MAVLRRAAVLASLALTACAIVTGLDDDYHEVACLNDCPPDAAADAALDATTEAPVDASPADAGGPYAVFLFSEPAYDFDVEGDDLYALASSARIDHCGADDGGVWTCAMLIPKANMPPEDTSRTNTSIAVVAGRNLVLVAQRGDVPCFDTRSCADDAGIPGVWSVGLSAAHALRREQPAVPIEVWKAQRATDGWLVGRENVWALAQTLNNEGPSAASVAVYFWEVSHTGPPGLATKSFDTAPSQPLVFVPTPVDSEARGFLGTGGGFVEISKATTPVATTPLRAAGTTTDNLPASDVFFQSAGTTPGEVDSFHGGASSPVMAYELPGLDPAGNAQLVGTTHWLGFVARDGDAGVSFHACTVQDIRAHACKTPLAIPLPLANVIRARTRGDDVFFLGRNLDGGTTGVVRVSF